MGYVPLNNYNHDGGYKRIQSGPNHQGFIVLTSGSTAYGANEGIVVPGSPLSGTAALGAWDYDSNWRYVPSTLPSQSGALDPTPYNVSGALDTYDATRIYTRDTVAGAQAASAIGPETGKVNPRGGALQPRADVTRPETYMYYGGAAPDNQDYSPYNTPDANSAAEGKTGGGVTHRSFESSLLTNVLGSQGTSDRSQWRYHQPVYCKTYTETRRSETPGLMSTPLRYVYRGSASSYNYNYAGELLANKGGFELLPYDDEVLGCPFPVGCPTTSGDSDQLLVGDTLTATVFCPYTLIEWFRSDNTKIGEGLTYTVTTNDAGYQIYFKVTYPDGTTDRSSLSCLSSVLSQINGTWFNLQYTQDNGSNSLQTPRFTSVIEPNGDLYLLQSLEGSKSVCLHKVSDSAVLQWVTRYTLPASEDTFTSRGVDSPVLINLDVNTLEIVYLPTPITASLYTTPSRMYKFKVDKSNGALLDTKTVAYTGAISRIVDVAVDESKNYYFLCGTGGGAEMTAIMKFNTDFNFVWYRVLTRKNSSCTESVTFFPAANIHYANNKLTFTGWLSGFALTPSFASISTEGDALEVSLPIYVGSAMLAVRSLDRDADNNVYTLGGSDDDLSLTGGIYVIKQKDVTSGYEIVWGTNIFPSVAFLNRRVFTESRQLKVINDKVVVVGVFGADIVSVPQRTNLLVTILNKDTGVIEKVLRVRRTDVSAGNNFGQKVNIEALPQQNGFIVVTSWGRRLRFNLNALPSGLYPIQNELRSYEVIDITPVQSDITNALSFRTTCTRSNIIASGIASDFTYPVVSGLQVPPTGVLIFGDIANTISI